MKKFACVLVCFALLTLCSTARAGGHGYGHGQFRSYGYQNTFFSPYFAFAPYVPQVVVAAPVYAIPQQTYAPPVLAPTLTYPTPALAPVAAPVTLAPAADVSYAPLSYAQMVQSYGGTVGYATAYQSGLVQRQFVYRGGHFHRRHR